MVEKNCWNLHKTQTILPLVFDDSISYYEAVAKLTHIVNQLIGIVNNDIDDNLKEYIDNRFDNLMINATYDEITETIYLEKGTMN